MLDIAQIQLIESDVESARITLYNLSDELVDHICCAIEDQMRNGKSFDEAYALLKEQTGIKVLQNIQENTLYLTDKKYRLMKTTMKITGNVSLALLALGTLFKIFHWPGAAVMLVVGFALLCFLFFPAVVYINHRDGNTPRRPLLNASILIGGILLMLGILFKVMHWPMAGPMLFFGFAIVLLVFLPTLMMVKIKEAGTKSEKQVYILGAIALIVFEAATMFKMFHYPGAGPLMIFGSILLVAVFLPVYTRMLYIKGELKTGQFIYLVTLAMYAVVLTALMSMNVSRNILGCFEKEHSNAVAINKYFEKKNAGLAATPQDSTSAKQTEKIQMVQKEASVVKNYIQDIKLKLVQEIEKIDREHALAAISETSHLEYQYDYKMSWSILLEPDGRSLGKNLREKIIVFKEQALVFTSSDAELSRSISILADTPSRVENGETVEWEVFVFAGAPEITLLSILADLERNINQVEFATIIHIQKQHI